MNSIVCPVHGGMEDWAWRVVEPRFMVRRLQRQGLWSRADGVL